MRGLRGGLSVTLIPMHLYRGVRVAARGERSAADPRNVRSPRAKGRRSQTFGERLQRGVREQGSRSMCGRGKGVVGTERAGVTRPLLPILHLHGERNVEWIGRIGHGAE